MSGSVTRTVPKTNHADSVVAEQRVFDYLYDPVYTLSSEVDHVKSSLKAYASKERIRRVPEFGSMFSNLPHYPPYTVQLDTADPVPASIDRGWRGHTEQRKEALQQLAGFIPIGQSWVKREECQVTGADRWKFFKRPLIPFAQQVPPDVVFDLPKEDFVSTGAKNAKLQPTHTVGVQTDFRESETQTEPYSPEYMVLPGASPSELLQLTALTWGRGLPAGMAEVEMIMRARAKRVWEASLPPLHDLKHLDKRRRMMEEMEAKEWAFREGEIQKLQEARLAVLKDLMRQRDKAQREVTNERLNQIYSKKQKEKDAKQQKIHNDYTRSLRKLEAKRRSVNERLERCGVGKDCTDSRAKVPQTHRNTHRNNEFKSHYLDTYEGLLELEAGLSVAVLRPWAKRTKPKVHIIKDVIKAPEDKTLEVIKKYKASKENEQMAKRHLRFLVKKEKPVPRPPTPKVEEPPEGDEEKELAVIFLQKLLRGRSTQYQMYKGKENHMELILELRTVHALQKEEQDLHKADKKLVIALKNLREKNRIKTAQKEALQARVVGSELEHLFDTFSKELIRLQEERRIHAFTLLAERDRRIREAEESGRRQVEEWRRKEEDEIFRQVVEVHQETVDLYLEDIILGTLEHTADQQAREEIHHIAKEVNDIAYAMEESQNNLQSEEIVSELVYSFLIPEVQKISVRQKVRQRQHKHLQAAQSIIQGAIERPGTSARALPTKSSRESLSK
ncbi:hypothetical protein Q5P01_013647 [Channa striata]|uniref:Cilia- and flagella-associated protein 91 n=1 Tax=Channa striata TaxID=64152 RepID=A0AA88SHY7_CHASR|nr:hypothetical protein Q5P01_013647 [Channa striata]